MSNSYNFNVGQQQPSNYAAPLLDFSALSGQPKKQQASTGSTSRTDAQNLGAAIGKWLNAYQNQYQRYAQPQQVPQQVPQQAPMQLTPQQLTPQQSVTPVNNPGSPFNVTGGLY